jgi:hypothetical protein
MPKEWDFQSGQRHKVQVGKTVVKGEALLDNKVTIAHNLLQCFHRRSRQDGLLAGQTTLVTRASLFTSIQNEGYLPVTLDMKAQWVPIEDHLANGTPHKCIGYCSQTTCRVP